MTGQRPFPGFEAIHVVDEPMMNLSLPDAPYRGHVGGRVPLATLDRLALGEERLVKPITVRHDEGRARPEEVIWTTSLVTVVVGQRVVDVLTAHGFTGWATYPVRVHAKGGRVVPGYHGLAITGRCGPTAVDRSRVVESAVFGPVYLGLSFEPATWDGSDLFCPVGNPLGRFVVAAVKEALEGAGVGNIEFTRLSEFPAPKVIDDFLLDRG